MSRKKRRLLSQIDDDLFGDIPPPSGKGTSVTVNEENDEIDEKVAHLDLMGFSQWSVNGQGWIPTKTTVKELPAAVYKIVFINDARTFVPQKIISDGLFEMSDSESNSVVSEIESFWTKKEVFKKLGFAFKRGFLLHGPHGSGKTSVIKLILKKIVDAGGMALVVGSMNPHHISEALSDLRKIEPERSIVVVLEDIDAYIKANDESEVLSILDGELSIENVIFLATTNYPEDLENRVRDRPSRFDRVIEIGKPSLLFRATYLRSIGAHLSEDKVEKWAKATDGLSIAHIKEIVIGVEAYGKSFEEMLDQVKGMKKIATQSSGKSSVGFGND